MGKFPNLFKDSISQKENSIQFLIKHIHCNPELPEYNNIYIPNKKENYALISNGNEFIYKTKKSVIKRLIDNKLDILEKYVDEHGDKLGKQLLKHYNHYMEDLDNEDDMKETEEEITCLLLNMKKLIERNDDDKKYLKLLEDNIHKGTPINLE